ncbi:MAG: glycoside hydrolase family 18 protein [Gemmatimonadota bacterium]
MRPAARLRERGLRATPAVAGVALLLLAACGGGQRGGQSANSSGSATRSPASAAPGSASPAVPGHRYVSFTSYPGWIQGSIPPAQFDYTPWTIISDFGLWPAPGGGIAVGDMQSLANIPPAVAAAHQARRLIIMAVGEQGQGARFASAASPAHRAAFIRAIVSYVAKYHFDGVDIDWEEEVPAHQADYAALVSGVRSALDQAFPGRHLYLSADVNPGQVPPPIAARIAPYVDSLNDESFQDNGAGSIAAYLRAGIPASKLLIGIGVAPGYYDTTVARVAAKVKYVQQHGLAGTLFWQPGNLHTYRTDPRLVPLRQMVNIPG